VVFSGAWGRELTCTPRSDYAGAGAPVSRRAWSKVKNLVTTIVTGGSSY